MKIYIQIDNDNNIIGFVNCFIRDTIKIEVDGDFNLSTLIYYKYVNGEIVHDQNREDILKQAEIERIENYTPVPTTEEVLEQELANTNVMILELTEMILGGM